jgi:hypothetical protein
MIYYGQPCAWGPRIEERIVDPDTGEDVPFAVFKPGETRAEKELSMRRMGHRIGLPYAVAGVFCSIANPRLPQEATVMELWNGNLKVVGHGPKYRRDVYRSKLDDPPTMTGILEPYLPSDPKARMTIQDFTNMTGLALAVGARDVKLDGMAITQPKDGKPGVVLFDTADWGTARITPSHSPNRSPNRSTAKHPSPYRESHLQQRVAATHLPYMQDSLATTPIPQETLRALYGKIHRLHESSFMKELAEERIHYADRAAEDLVPGCPNGGATGWDQGGFPVFVKRAPRLVEAEPIVDVNQTDRLLTQAQLEAFRKRVGRLHAFLYHACFSGAKPVTPLDMVGSVDRFYQRHWDTVQRHGRWVPADLVGRFTPAQTVPLSEQDIGALRRGDSSPSDHPRRRQSPAPACHLAPPHQH